MWADNETNEDLLGFQVHADLIKSLILDDGLLPITIGIFADWGGGKTSIMKIIEKSFASEKLNDPEGKNTDGVLCLYFNGWLFEGYDDAKSALLSSVIMALGEHKRFGSKIKDTCVSLLRSINWLRVAYLGAKNVAIPAIAAYASGGATIVPQLFNWLGQGTNKSLGNEEATTPMSTVPPISDNVNKKSIDWETLIKNDSNPQNPLDIKDFREKFGEMLAKSDIKTLVVLIDDLDRCSPERIVENLEAIKLFLNVEKTAFIIGADQRIVRHAIELKYGLKKEDDSDSAYNTIVNDYLEKLIQYPYYLPKLSPIEIETYISLLFSKRYLSSAGFQTVLSKCDDARNNNRYSAFGEHAISEILRLLNGETEIKKLQEVLAITSIISPLITECLKGNPRQVKRFLNLFELRKKLSIVARLNIRNDILVKLMILEYSYPDHYKQLYEWQVNDEGKPRIFEELENEFRPELLKSISIAVEHESTEESGKKNQIPKTKKIDVPNGLQKQEIPSEWKNDGIKKWLQTEPSLVGVDLRDYFWLTRDRLQSTLVGMVLISPIIRTYFTRLMNEEKGEKFLADIMGMPFTDQQILCSLIRKEICIKPDSSKGYKVLNHLIEKGASCAADELLQVFKSVTIANMPTSIGMMIQGLEKSIHGQLPALIEIVQIIQNNQDTGVGKAFISKN